VFVDELGDGPPALDADFGEANSEPLFVFPRNNADSVDGYTGIG
jgi:hypothetical protein